MKGDDVNTVEALNELKLNFNKEDIDMVKYICWLVSDRAAILVAICKLRCKICRVSALKYVEIRYGVAFGANEQARDDSGY